MPLTFTNPDDDELKRLMKAAKRIAIVGLSPDPDRPSSGVARFLQERGYEIVPVNPGHARLMGLHCYPDLAAVPGTVDIVDVFRAAVHVAAITDQFLARKDPVLWLQDGVIDLVSAARAVAAGRTVVMDRCTAKVAARF